MEDVEDDTKKQILIAIAALTFTACDYSKNQTTTSLKSTKNLLKHQKLQQNNKKADLDIRSLQPLRLLFFLINYSK